MQFGCNKLDEFKHLMDYVCSSLQDNYREVRFLSLHHIGPGAMSRIANIEELFTALIQRDVISPEDLLFLLEVLITIEFLS